MAAEKATTPLLGGKTYDLIRNIVQYVFPGLGTLYFTLATIWGLGHAEQIVGTLTACTLFLSLILGYSKRSYNAVKYDGAIEVEQQGDKKVFSLVLHSNPEDLEQKDQVIFQVKGCS